MHLRTGFRPAFTLPLCAVIIAGVTSAADDRQQPSISFESGNTAAARNATEGSATAPLLVVLMDFSDSDMSAILADPELDWAGLMFGTDPAEGNHYWNEATGGQFHLSAAGETYGVADNGVVRVWISDAKPTGTERYQIEHQTWIPEALDLASDYIRFADYDTDSDGSIDNGELSILFVLNIELSNVAIAGAQANIPINHPIQGTGPTIENFVRTNYTFTSIGVNVHELAHHVFGWKHFVEPDQHGLMGSGSYGEDPVITLLHRGNDHWGTRPTHPIGFNKARVGFVTPTEIHDTIANVTLNSARTNDYNVIELPVVDGFLHIENRTREGYDRSIPFCDGHEGALFITEVAQYVRSINIPSIEFRRDTFEYDVPTEDLCDHYALSGHNDSFSYGGYTINNVSAAGPTMTFDIVREDVTPTIQAHKYRYKIADMARPGSWLWHILTAVQGATSQIDFSTFPLGDDASQTFTISLDAFYNTGEVRSVNLDTTWTTSSSYLQVEKGPNGGGGTFTPGEDAFIDLTFDPDATYATSAVVDVEHDGFQSSFELTGLPCSFQDLDGDGVGETCNGPYLSYDSFGNLTEVDGNGNGTLDPGETWELTVNLRNDGNVPLRGVSAELRVDPAQLDSVSLLEDDSTYPDVPAGQVVSSESAYSFRIDRFAPCGEWISFSLIPRSTDPANTYPFEVGVIRLLVGGAGPKVQVFFDDFDPPKDWTCWDEWEIGVPEGRGGPLPDPEAGFQGPQVLGTDLSGLGLDPDNEPGNYENNETSYCYSPEIDGSGYVQLEVSFARWLNVRPGDTASFLIWTYEQGSILVDSWTDTADDSWNEETPWDISGIADGLNPFFFLFQTESDSQDTASGWNIDAFEVRGVPIDSCEPFESVLPGEATRLSMDKGAPGQLRLQWSRDCGAATTYGIYRGDLRVGNDSIIAEPGHCDVGATDATIPEGSGVAEFFLVVPHKDGEEGSYGADSTGSPRPAATGGCYPQGAVDVCAP